MFDSEHLHLGGPARSIGLTPDAHVYHVCQVPGIVSPTAKMSEERLRFLEGHANAPNDDGDGKFVCALGLGLVVIFTTTIIIDCCGGAGAYA